MDVILISKLLISYTLRIMRIIVFLQKIINQVNFNDTENDLY